MEQAGIVPEFLDHEPPSLLTVIYPNFLQVPQKLVQGTQLTPAAVKDEPEVSWASEPEKLYTLVMFDPDCRPEAVSIKHWLVVNIPGNDVGKGVVLAGYRGSGPPKGTGLHRYIFVVFEQNGTLDTAEEGRDDKESTVYRRGWSVKEFVRKYNLGSSVAGNYFRAQWDPYVDQRKNQRNK